jgi:putative DNA primase/helicase
VIDLALFYASKGWPVFPLAAGAKIPAIPKERGGHGCLDATLERKMIETWWDQYPAANIGIATGRRAGLLVIDIDPRKTSDWLQSVNSLKLPQTFTVRTASGGFHLYFASPAHSKITIGANLLPGIDWRGQGGYVVGAGSIVKGVTYEIVRSCAIVTAPAALLARIGTHKKARVAARDSSGHMVIPDGSRSDHLIRIACAIRRFGVEFNAIYEALKAVNADHCEPGLPEQDLRTIAASAARYPADDGYAQSKASP